MNFHVFCLTFLVLISIISAQKVNQRHSNRNHSLVNRKRKICHLKELEKCFDNVCKLGKEPNPTSIIATEESFNKLCR
jgi:hypothetical protein